MSILTLQAHSSHVYFQNEVNVAMELHISQKSTFESVTMCVCMCMRVRASMCLCEYMYLRLDNT